LYLATSPATAPAITITTNATTPKTSKDFYGKNPQQATYPGYPHNPFLFVFLLSDKMPPRQRTHHAPGYYAERIRADRRQKAESHPTKPGYGNQGDYIK
jgi:hypothetical protein